MKTPLRFAIAGVASLLVALVAWSIGAESPEEAQNRERIASKSEAEREILRRRYDAFLKLPAAERDAIRKLHQATQADPGLATTLSDYESFVSQLYLWDQQELRDIKDPAKRVAHIRQLIADRAPPEDHGRPSWLSGRGSERFTFTPQNFDQAMTIVEGLLNLSSKEQSGLAELDPPHRHLRVAEFAAKRFHSQPKWPDKPDYERLVKLLPDDEYRARLLREDHKFPEEFRRRFLAYSLMKSLVVEWDGIIRREIPPEELQQALNKMKEEEQWEVSRHDPDRLMHEVMNQIAATDDEIGDYAKDYVKAAKLKAEFDFSFGRRPPGPRDDRGRRGPGPERGRGPGDGGPPPSFGDGGPRFGDGRGGPPGPPDGPPPGGRDSRGFGPRDGDRRPSRQDSSPGDRPPRPE